MVYTGKRQLRTHLSALDFCEEFGGQGTVPTCPTAPPLLGSLDRWDTLRHSAFLSEDRSDVEKISFLTVYRDTRAQLRMLSEIALSKSTEDAWEALDRLSNNLGFDYSGVGLIGMSDRKMTITLEHASPFFHRSFSEYHKRQLHLQDPAARFVAQGQSLTFAHDAIATAPPALKEGGRKVAEHLSRDRIAGHAALRVDFPEHGFAGFFGIGQRETSQSGNFATCVEAQFGVLKLAATAYASVAMRNMGRQNSDILSTREAQVLTHIARGLTPQEIAEEEGRAIATVRHQIASARTRLGARNTSHAVAIALQIHAIRL